MAKNHGKQIKNDAKYEALRRGGASKEKAARIANSPGASRRGGENDKLEERTRKNSWHRQQASALRAGINCEKTS